jgi:hypothetical protein
MTTHKTVITPSPQQVAVLKNRLKTMLGTKVEVPEGHVIAVAHARVFGPKMKTTPHGTPIVIQSGPFDLTVETPQHAIARAASKWHGIQIHEPSWEIELEGTVRTDLPPAHPPIMFTKFFHMLYLPELSMLKHKGLSHETMHQPFLSSYYLNITHDKFGRVKPKVTA